MRNQADGLQLKTVAKRVMGLEGEVCVEAAASELEGVIKSGNRDASEAAMKVAGPLQCWGQGARYGCSRARQAGGQGGADDAVDAEFEEVKDDRSG